MRCPAQCDAWRPLRLPAVLVGDGRLGGISTTLAAADSLLLRGYDLAAVAVSCTVLHRDTCSWARRPPVTYIRYRLTRGPAVTALVLRASMILGANAHADSSRRGLLAPAVQE